MKRPWVVAVQTPAPDLFIVNVNELVPSVVSTVMVVLADCGTKRGDSVEASKPAGSVSNAPQTIAVPVVPVVRQVQ